MSASTSPNPLAAIYNHCDSAINAIRVLEDVKQVLTKYQVDQKVLAEDKTTLQQEVYILREEKESLVRAIAELKDTFKNAKSPETAHQGTKNVQDSTTTPRATDDEAQADTEQSTHQQTALENKVSEMEEEEEEYPGDECMDDAPYDSSQESVLETQAPSTQTQKDNDVIGVECTSGFGHNAEEVFVQSRTLTDESQKEDDDSASYATALQDLGGGGTGMVDERVAETSDIVMSDSNEKVVLVDECETNSDAKRMDDASQETSEKIVEHSLIAKVAIAEVQEVQEHSLSTTIVQASDGIVDQNTDAEDVDKAPRDGHADIEMTGNQTQAPIPQPHDGDGEESSIQGAKVNLNEPSKTETRLVARSFENLSLEIDVDDVDTPKGHVTADDNDDGIKDEEVNCTEDAIPGTQALVRKDSLEGNSEDSNKQEGKSEKPQIEVVTRTIHPETVDEALQGHPTEEDGDANIQDEQMDCTQETILETQAAAEKDSIKDDNEVSNNQAGNSENSDPSDEPGKPENDVAARTINPETVDEALHSHSIEEDDDDNIQDEPMDSQETILETQAPAEKDSIKGDGETSNNQAGNSENIYPSDEPRKPETEVAIRTIHPESVDQALQGHPIEDDDDSIQDEQMDSQETILETQAAAEKDSIEDGDEASNTQAGNSENSDPNNEARNPETEVATRVIHPESVDQALQGHPIEDDDDDIIQDEQMDSQETILDTQAAAEETDSIEDDDEASNTQDCESENNYPTDEPGKIETTVVSRNGSLEKGDRLLKNHPIDKDGNDNDDIHVDQMEDHTQGKILETQEQAEKDFQEDNHGASNTLEGKSRSNDPSEELTRSENTVAHSTGHVAPEADDEALKGYSTDGDDGVIEAEQIDDTNDSILETQAPRSDDHAMATTEPNTADAMDDDTNATSGGSTSSGRKRRRNEKWYGFSPKKWRRMESDRLQSYLATTSK